MTTLCSSGQHVWFEPADAAKCCNQFWRRCLVVPAYMAGSTSREWVHVSELHSDPDEWKARVFYGSTAVSEWEIEYINFLVGVVAPNATIGELEPILLELNKFYKSDSDLAYRAKYGTAPDLFYSEADQRQDDEDWAEAIEGNLDPYPFAPARPLDGYYWLTMSEMVTKYKHETGYYNPSQDTRF